MRSRLSTTVIPSLQLKAGYHCIPDENIRLLTKTATYIAEISNLTVDHGMPYVGKSAFAHKGGMHVDGVNKNPASFEHIPPETVGNKRNILLSEVAGRGAVIKKLSHLDHSITKDLSLIHILSFKIFSSENSQVNLFSAVGHSSLPVSYTHLFILACGDAHGRWI